MNRKRVISGAFLIWIILIFNTVSCLSMHVIDYSHRPCYLEEENNTVSHNSTDKHSMIATAYCLQGKTASSEYVREGIVASKPEWIGKKVIIYYEHKDGTLGECLGCFDVKDTGGDNIQAGRVIDIWMPTYEQCKQFGRRRVAVFLIDEEVTNEKTKETYISPKEAVIEARL